MAERKFMQQVYWVPGLALMMIPYISDPIYVLFPMVFFGIGWAAMMGIPYTMVSKIVPQDRRGVYMGILNMMIVIPMGIETLTFGPIFKNFLGGNAINAMLFAGTFLYYCRAFGPALKCDRGRKSSIGVIPDIENSIVP